MKTHLSLMCISFPSRSQLDFLNLAFTLRFDFKHEQTQIPTVSVYVYISIFVWIKSAFLVSQSPDWPTCHALVATAEQACRTQTRLLSNDTQPKHALKPLLNGQLIGQN